MQTNTFFSAALAALSISLSNALPTIQENSLVPLGDPLKTNHPEAYSAFLTAPLITFDTAVSRRQDVPADSTPDPNRPVVTPPYIFVLQCDIAGFRGNCLSFGAPPGECVNYSSFNGTQAFLDEYENKTSSLSTNTGGNCQFYKFIDCNNKGDDRGVTLDYNYDLSVVTDDYGGDYDNQISSWRC
ncbi:uncharacterized protein J7T55_013240 [Diaporthe amygdali]|uniref:uncharacterized protein n=1 Tax=Phomopsis amygdali TaxID=1214568 RepID=UPI0022FED40E|nr:uncharacterized protein J7T55_013240 [Diaporthe amygdali]KAJ0119005.1 uncharacterized protein J7T55_013240 [Diaporthe amygdali]